MKLNSQAILNKVDIQIKTSFSIIVIWNSTKRKDKKH